MKTSIKLLLSTALLLAATVFTFAQRGGQKNQNPEARADKLTSRMVESLSLNEQQAAQVKEINVAYVQKLHSARTANEGNNRTAMRSMKEDLDKGLTAEYAKVLTPAQMQTFEAKKEEMGSKGRRGNSVKRGGSVEDRVEKNTNRMVENLSLDQAQTANVRAINMKYAEKLKSASEANEGKDKEAMKSIRADLNESKSMELEKVLSPEQFQTYTEMKAKEDGKRKGGKKRLGKKKARLERG